MKFYDCTMAPSPRRVRIFLSEKGITPPPTVQIDLRNGEQFSESLRRINPECTVPVLELDDGTVIAESIAICRYFEETHRRCSGPRRWSAPKSRCGSGASSSA